MSLTFTPAFRAITPEYLKGGRLLQLLDSWGWHMQRALEAPQDGSEDSAKQVLFGMRNAWNALLPLADPGENWQFRTAVEGLTSQRARDYWDGTLTADEALAASLSDLELALKSSGLGDPVPGEPPHGLQGVEVTVALDPRLGPRFEARDVRPPATAEIDPKQVSMVVVMVIGGLLGIAAILMIVWLARRRKRNKR